MQFTNEEAETQRLRNCPEEPQAHTGGEAQFERRWKPQLQSASSPRLSSAPLGATSSLWREEHKVRRLKTELGIRKGDEKKEREELSWIICFSHNFKFRFRKPNTHCPSFIQRLSELKTDAIIVWQGMSGRSWLFYTIVWFGAIFLSTPQFILLQIEKVGLDHPDIPSHFNGLFSLNIKSLKIGSKVSNNSCPLKR